MYLYKEYFGSHAQGSSPGFFGGTYTFVGEFLSSTISDNQFSDIFRVYIPYVHMGGWVFQGGLTLSRAESLAFTYIHTCSVHIIYRGKVDSTSSAIANGCLGDEKK